MCTKAPLQVDVTSDGSTQSDPPSFLAPHKGNDSWSLTFAQASVLKVPFSSHSCLLSLSFTYFCLLFLWNFPLPEMVLCAYWFIYLCFILESRSISGLFIGKNSDLCLEHIKNSVNLYLMLNSKSGVIVALPFKGVCDGSLR
jgi:hypothetical protein